MSKTLPHDTMVDPRSRWTEVQSAQREGHAATLPATLPTDGTMAAEDMRFSMTPLTGAAMLRTTVLPRLEGGEIVADSGRPRYERVGPLGEGGIGEVSLARDQDIDRPVAIKRLRPEHQNAGALLRFAQEVRTIGSLEHPNIVPVHDVGIDDQGQHYFVMKFV